MSRLGTVPAVLVTGISEPATASVTLALQWDRPRTVVVSHRLDVARSELHRTVSDVDGVVEQVVHQLDHACVACALREDIVPTLERVCADGRWDAVVAHLPVAAEALQVCRLTELDPGAAPHLRISAVVAALEADGVQEDLLGSDLLRERGSHSGEDDERGVADTCAALVEYADVIVLAGESGDSDRALVRALTRPDAKIVIDPTLLEGSELFGDRHRHRHSEEWVSPTRAPGVPLVVGRHAWTLELSSVRPFHPQRLLDDLEALGAGRLRSRGCFWLPTRPGDVGVWEGAGGQLSIGQGSPWGARRPFTRIVITGASESRDRIEQLRDVFAATLLDDAEIEQRGMLWEAFSDGFEPWLGAIRREAA